MNKILKRLLTGVLTLATVFTALPTTAVHAAETQYWTESEERVGIVEKVMNDGSIGSTFNEGHMTVEGEDAYCIDINTGFKNGYKTRSDASTRMTADQIEDVALSLEYVKQYTKSHTGLSSQHAYLLRQLVVWQRLSVHLGWSCDNVRASYDEISKSVQDEVFAGAKAFVRENKGRYDCYGYIYTGEGQDLGQFFAELAVGNGKIQKSSSNTTVTNGNDCYSLSGATYGVYSDKGCTKSVATLTTNANGNTDTVELRAATYYVKETKAPKGFQLDKNVYTMTVKVNETTTLKVSDKPKVTDTLVELFKIDMEISKATPQGNASLEGAEFVWKYYDGYYTKDNLPSEPTRTWTTKTIAEKDSNNEVHYITRLADSYKVLGDSFYTQNGTICLPLGTITVEEKTAPNGYLLEGAYMQAAGSSEQIKGVYVAQITEDGELAALSGSNQYSVLDKVIRGGVKIQKRDLETKDTKAQGGATLKDTAFEIISLNDNAVLVDGKLYNKNEVVKTIHTGVDGIATTAADTLPYGKYRIEESNAPEGYLTDGAKPIEFEITEDGKIVDLTDEAHSIYNQIKRGDIEGVKIGAGTHKRLANVPFRITGKTTGESHIIVTDANGQFSTSSDWVSHKQNTNAGKTSEDGIWFGTSTPDDSKGALLYDTYTIEELRCDSNKGMTLIPAFDVVVSRNKVVVDLGMAKKALTKLFNTIMMRAGITLIITTAFSISTMFYSISSGYPFFMVAFLQIVTFAGIYFKLGDLMTMFSLQSSDTQQVSRRIMRHPYMFLNRRARRLERKIGRTMAAGAAGGVAGAAAASASTKKADNTKQTGNTHTRANHNTSASSSGGNSKPPALPDSKSQKPLALPDKKSQTDSSQTVHSSQSNTQESQSTSKRGIVDKKSVSKQPQSDKKNPQRPIVDKERQSNGSATKRAAPVHERPATTPVPVKSDSQAAALKPEQNVKERPVTVTKEQPQSSKSKEPVTKSQENVRTQVVRESRPADKQASSAVNKHSQATTDISRQTVQRQKQTKTVKKKTTNQSTVNKTSSRKGGKK